MPRRVFALMLLAVAIVATIATVASTTGRDAAPATAAPAAPAATTNVATAHYRITSSADQAQTARTAAAVEALHAAWSAFVADGDGAPREATAPLQMRLYRDRAEFKANNRSRPWAEAYYRTPVCHAYYAADGANPTHWMLHEAVHQLNREAGRLAPAKWQNEGLASYFGASRLRDGVLEAGTIDPDAYPIWWLDDLALSGDVAADVAAGRFIPLRALIAGNGPPLDRHVNLYYLEWWSLTHFLLHHDGGRHAAAYRRTLAGDGSLAEFEREFGDVEVLQAAWYAYLRARVDDARGHPR